MIEPGFEKINNFDSVKITLASPDDIRSWSFGEVKKPETINYRTYRAEKEGLFCERIFGPERDYECACGRHKGTKFKGIICERCGVKVAPSRVRRKRMGHITLAAPVVHIWFFKAMPSRLSTLLGFKTSDLEKIVYFQDYVVIDPGDTPLVENQLLSEEEYRDALGKYGREFRASMGAEAVEELVDKLDLELLSVELHEQINSTGSKQKINELSKRLKTVNALRESGNDPRNMIMKVLPVIPPDLRPLVMLESGNFATSDLNDLYRRIINRNNRLAKLMDLNAPEVIIRNEKRMLQQAVDALLDNNRCRRPVVGSNSRALKSLTDMIKGKQGRFRENLLGKRVDYSARSVIVVGPWLKLNQCGLPKKIALELYQPFIIRRLREKGYADTVKSAKRMLERREDCVWDILEEVIYQHPILLNRAPTLHRMGIQAFEPVLVEGNAIHLHPLACKGFNADFDGDQMAVHLPLSSEAQVEAHTLILATNNIFSPANGSPNLTPSQDIVLGIYYLTTVVPGEKGEGMIFRDTYEAISAYDRGVVSAHAKVKVRLPEGKEFMDEKGVREGGVVDTTAGRCLFNDMFSIEIPFFNLLMSSKQLGKVISECYQRIGSGATVDILDKVKDLGFKYAALAGLSFGITDLKVPETKTEILDKSQKEVDKISKNYSDGLLTETERKNQIIDVWTHARIEVTNAMLDSLQSDTRDGKPYLNPIWVMRHSGARGSVDQIMQLAGMRALMAKPSGEIIETPIKSNFREGLNVLEYFSSTHGARKGLADTALKTADSGYLTRKLADVAQNVIVTEDDCGTLQGVTKTTVYKDEAVDIPLSAMIVGRTARDNIKDPIRDEMIVAENEIITPKAAAKIEELGLDSIRVRSALTCDAREGVCAKCYGWDMSKSREVEKGMAVGIVAAQSIGEPGTQLTMRTFHTGGIASRAVVEDAQKAARGGTIKYRDIKYVTVSSEKGEEYVCLKRKSELAIVDERERELEKYPVEYGYFIQVKDGQKVKKGQKLFRWDPHRIPILAEVDGRIRLHDIIEGETIRIEEERKGQKPYPVVIEHKGDRHPQVVIEDETGKILDVHYLPAKARIGVEDGQEVKAGALLARLPRASDGTQDITGGLPRVTEIFEARKPKEPAAMAEISGVVELQRERRRGKITITVRNEQSGLEREHHVPRDRHLNVHAGDTVQAGDPLTQGPLVPHDILRIKGEEALQGYLLNEIQNVYRAQNVKINDKHVEIIISQMLRKVEIDTVGDSGFLPGEVVDKSEFKRVNAALASELIITDPGDTDLKEGQKVSKEELSKANEKVELLVGEPAKGKRPQPATANTLLLGITKSSLRSESFISAASFQETTKVLTEASLSGRIDKLRGLKENVILGRLIPAGTGFKDYEKLNVVYNAEEPIPEEIKESKDAEAAADAAIREALGL
ncbi:DNA-directed RNA polymerase subunit beta' [Sedimentisphaera cyanobacteriorum]|uniref:DNA-directed RNA polymerase subunit beta' n=1 Tax=Sedimentisphaera cyanobacteriorum TaxID=1940790 RepID=A0A1Q2HSU6_9BACT|nr:DNA-directed RNA polymerase subunit beta' [Sedimentisphaera cyanobacteriorum]AQQ10313.1 DNA-directed RNA polymerase subunit beta' [Sedimentisphaera cyanobacteriorum]